MFDITRHPNIVVFRGIAAFVDRPTERTAHAYDFKQAKINEDTRLYFPRDVIEPSLFTLRGMPLHALSEAEGGSPAFGATAFRRNVGCVTGATLEGDAVVVEGFIWAHHFPEVAPAITRGDLGLCCDFIYGANFILKDGIKTPTGAVIFTGVSILKNFLCGFDGTKIEVIK